MRASTGIGSAQCARTPGRCLGQPERQHGAECRRGAADARAVEQRLRGRDEVLTAFLAVLVLVRRRVVDAEQSELFGEITLRRSESVAATTNSTRLNGSSFIDACAKLGDAAGRLTAVAMHSATEAALPAT